jgi:hypothetical protein
VELQLTHSIDIKSTVDRAWGVMQNKHKKKDPETTPPESNDSKSQQNLQLVPLGQDAQRKRYWVADGSCVFHFKLLALFPICVYLVRGRIFLAPMLSGVSRL